MLEKCCKICGKPFLAKQQNYTICSDECRKEARRRYYYENADYCNQRRKILYKKRNEERKKLYWEKYRRIKYCKICNCELPNGKQAYCMDCLLNMWETGDRPHALHILSCRGYDTSMIVEEVNRRNTK